MKIFLLEDDQDLREALESVLELEGYEVITAADGSEAVIKAAESPFDIIVFDVKLPGPDGLEVFAQFKRENPDLLAVVMTGYATEQDTLRALRLGVGDYLKKPFPSHVLLEAVRRLETAVIRRRKLEESERASHKLMVWSLEFLVGSLEMARLSEGLALVECGRIAGKLALASGFPAETSQALQCAVLYRFLSQFSEDSERVEDFLNILPSTVTALLTQMSEVQKEELDPNVLSELGLSCQKLSEDADGLSALEQQLGVSLGSGVPQRQGRERRQLLSLGRSLAATGEGEAAREAFSKVAEGSRSPEAGQGRLELARLAWVKGDKTEVKAQLRSIVELIPQLGPQAGCELQLEAGLTALSMELPGGKPLLDSSLKKLERLNLKGLYHQAILGLKACDVDSPEALTEVQLEAVNFQLDQGLGDLVLSHANWFLNIFLKLQLVHPNTNLRKLMVRLVQNAPRSVGRLLTPTLEEPAIELLLGFIEEVGASGYVASLERYFAQCKSKELKSRVNNLLNTVTTQEAPTLRLYSLGPFEVWVGDHRLSEKAWRTYRSRFLLACLASRTGKPLLSETVIEQFWPGVRPESGKKNLSQTASDLRKALTENGFQMADDLLIRKHEMISLNQDFAIWHDIDSFRREMDKARRELEAGRNRVAHNHLRQAFSLVRGDYLEDCPMEWVLNQRREFERLTTDCCELLTKTCIDLGHHPEAIEVANTILDKDPCHQPLHILVMQAQAAMGRPELALRQFEQAEKALRIELGVEPSTDLLRAHQIAKMAL